MGTWLPQLLNVTWCGPICIPPTDQLVRKGQGPVNVVAPNRPWEALRYKLVAGLTAAGEPGRWQLLADLWDSLPYEWPLAIFPQLTASEEFQCPPGRLVLRVAEAASMLAKGAPLPNLTSVVHDFLVPSHSLGQAFCSGWPVFRLLLFFAELSFDGARMPAFPNGIASQLEEEQNIRDNDAPFLKAFDEPSVEDSYSMVNDPVEAFHSTLISCALRESLDRCLLAQHQVLQMLHAAQSESFFGSGICPPHTIAAWLDHMEPAEVYPICVRSEHNAVDNEIRSRGRWGECSQFAAILDHAGTPNCLILDIGANIGACTLMFANLGYRVVAFEPLPRNAELLEASTRLNKKVKGVSLGWDIAGDARSAGAGAVAVLPIALGSSSGRGYIMERRGNAGDSIVFPEDVPLPCDNSTYLCHNQVVRMQRLDGLFSIDGERICLAKIDVQGAEYQVLQGAHGLLSQHRIRSLIFEWRPHSAIEAGRDPLATLEYLHRLRYRIMVPREWLDVASAAQMSWVDWIIAGKEEFEQLLNYDGDIVAIAAFEV